MPLVVAPSASNMLAHPDGERAVAAAASDAGIMSALSTFASKSVEECQAVSGTESARLRLASAFSRCSARQVQRVGQMLQIYTFKDRARTLSLVRRAEKAGVKALLLTVDVVVFGLRDNLQRVDFESPDHVPIAHFPNEKGLLKSVSALIDQSLTWNDVTWLTQQTNIPVLVKGVLSPLDAELAIEHGAAGIVVSNHGARQLDDAITPLEALPAIVRQVRRRVPVLVDGGVRSGSDILKALILGADACLIGRPAIYGIACDGQRGARAVFERLRFELDNVMAQLGLRALDNLPPELLVRVGAHPTAKL